MGLRLITPPVDTPVTVEEMQRHLNIDAEDDDLVLDGYIRAATAMFDGIDGLLGMALQPQTWEYVADTFPCGLASAFDYRRVAWSRHTTHQHRGAIEIPLRPIISVTSVTYLDGDGVEQTVDAENYTVDSLGIPNRIVPVGTYQWPATQCVAQAVRVLFVAGYEPQPVSDPAPSSVPENIRLAIMITAAAYHGTRGDDNAAVQMDIPMAAKMLLRRPLVIA